MFEFLNKPRLEQPTFLRMLRWGLCKFLEPIFICFKIKFLVSNMLAIGHLSNDVDCFLKEGIIGSNDPDRPKIALLSAPINRAPNNVLAGYWKDYLIVFTSPLICFFLYPLTRNPKTTYDVMKYAGRTDLLIGGRILADYPESKPLLSLKPKDDIFGQKQLLKMGIPESSWFVALHGRERGYVSKLLIKRKEAESYRNVNILSYIKAIKFITERGGWVIRMGDPTMTPLPPMKNIIDYANSTFKSERMDVFLCAKCRFFLGSASGLYYLASIFGRPVLLTNYTPPMANVFPIIQDAISIPQLLYCTIKKKILTFGEISKLNLKHINYNDDLKCANKKFIPNSPEDILLGVKEMFAREDSNFVYSDTENELQNKLKKLIDPGFNPSARVSSSFIMKYSYLLK